MSNHLVQNPVEALEPDLIDRFHQVLIMSYSTYSTYNNKNAHVSYRHAQLS